MPAASLGEPALDAAVARLAEVQPQATARASACLGRLLGGLRSSCWPEVAWCGSDLMWGGYPLELAFASDSEDIRYATEVAGPEVEGADRRARAEALLCELGAPAIDQGLRAAIDDLQRDGRLSFGAWVSGRHASDHDHYKYYFEVPRRSRPDPTPLLVRLLGPETVRPRAPAPLQLVGVAPGAAAGRDVLELYFDVPKLESWELPLLLSHAGLRHRTDELLDLLATCFRRPVRPSFPGVRFGCSFAGVDGGPPQHFTLFAIARSVFGSDRTARRRILALREERNWGFAAYEAVTAPLEQMPGCYLHHATVSFVVPPQGPLRLYLGMRPPTSPPVH